MNHGRLVFAQVTDLLPRKAFDLAVRRYRGDHHLRRFSCHDQLLGMIFAQLTGRTSLRETVLCLQALGAQRYRCGLRGPLAKSTWADANERRDWRIFQDTALAMIRTLRQGLPVDPELVQLQAQVYALDATFIELCLQLFPWAVFRRHKAAVKAHTQLDLKTGIPVFIRVSHGKKHDLWLFEQLVFEPGAYYVFDKGYCDFGRLYRLHTAGAFFVTRAKKNLDFGVRCRQAVPPDAPVKSDRLMRLRGPKTRQLYPDTLRLIKYVDPETGKRLVFLTNHLTLDALTIALLYQRRWQIELFFKWIKQHLHVKAFFGTSPNAVQTQLWIAVIVYVLLFKLKHCYQLPQTVNEILQILSVTLLQKDPINQIFMNTSIPDSEDKNRKQLVLFDL